MSRRIEDTPFNVAWAMLCNLLLSFGCFQLCRILFLAVNYHYYAGHLSLDLLLNMLKGGLFFDASTLVYVNGLYILLMLIPWIGKEKKGYQIGSKLVFVFLNAIALIANLADMIYFRYTGRRTTATIFSEFSHEGNIGKILGAELVNHWYLTVLFFVFIWAIWRLYRFPSELRKPNLRVYYPIQICLLLLTIPLCIFAIRGGIGRAVRPITISNANQYINRPVEAAIVLNTPFSIIRTIGKEPFENPRFLSDAEMLSLYSPVHYPQDSARFTPKNVVVFILESFSREYIGALRPSSVEQTDKESYTPFLDYLIPRSYTFEHAFGNGRKSIDGMPSVLSGIPMFVEPFFVTPAALNEVSGIAGELKKKGYHTAFFHGAANGSMGFQAFAKSTGFAEYYGRTEYESDSISKGSIDFDGTWAIWDEEFFQFFCNRLNSFKQPFAAAMFSASSHHPYAIPEKYKNTFPEGRMPIHKCIRYSDNALRLFFEKAAHEPWFKNTLFVITADHTNDTDMPLYQTDYGLFAVPIIFYDPGAGLTGRDTGLAQQIDIMPTILSYLNYDKPFVAFGSDLLHTPTEERFAVNYLNGIYQYFKGDYVLQFDGSGVKAVYDFKNDPFQKHNLLGRVLSQKDMEKELKAVIQQYMKRMQEDNLVIRE